MITPELITAALSTLLFAYAAVAQPSLPSTFKSRTVASPEGAEIFVRSAGSGPVVVLLHGYAETSDSWAPLAAELIKSYTVVVPDLRGIGRSSRPAGGYDKKTQAADIRAVVKALGYDRASVVSHDIGIMVAYAYAARYPDKVERLVVMDAPIPGIAPWDEIVRNPALWHFSFRGPDAERLVEGRERIYLDRIWNAFSGDPAKPDEATRAYYAAQYAQPGAMRAGFAHFTAFSQDVEDNKIFQRTKLTMPVLAVGGEKSFGATEAVVMRNVATNVREAVVPGAGHWLMEESPTFTHRPDPGLSEGSASARVSVRPLGRRDARRTGRLQVSRQRARGWHIGSLRHPHRCTEGRPGPRRSLHNHAEHTGAHAHCRPSPSGRSCGDRCLGSLVHRLRRLVQQRRVEGPAGRKLLHRAIESLALRGDAR
jgi:pimeloyl-ACP methyl ester carboxylesterase